MNTKKLLLVLGTTALTSSALVFVGCGDDNAATTPAPDTGTGGETSVPEGGSDAPADAPPDTAKPLGPIDRMGRPTINTLLIDKTRKDSYNHEDTYTAAASTTYDTDLDGHLKALDGLDGNSDYGTGTPHRLRDPLKLDTLVVGTQFPPYVPGTAGGAYMQMEGYVLFGVVPTNAGGRWMSDDIVDQSLKLLVCGPIRSSVQAQCPLGDGVDKATKDPTSTFPYLATPN